jgi:hypothetical protein
VKLYSSLSLSLSLSRTSTRLALLLYPVQDLLTSIPVTRSGDSFWRGAFLWLEQRKTGRAGFGVCAGGGGGGGGGEELHVSVAGRSLRRVVVIIGKGNGIRK